MMRPMENRSAVVAALLAASLTSLAASARLYLWPDAPGRRARDPLREERRGAPEAPARQQARGHVELPPRADRDPLRPEPLGALRGRTRGWKLGDHACGDRARRARRGGARRGEEL